MQRNNHGDEKDPNPFYRKTKTGSSRWTTNRKTKVKKLALTCTDVNCSFHHTANNLEHCESKRNEENSSTSSDEGGFGEADGKGFQQVAMVNDRVTDHGFAANQPTPVVNRNKMDTTSTNESESSEIREVKQSVSIPAPNITEAASTSKDFDTSLAPLDALTLQDWSEEHKDLQESEITELSDNSLEQLEEEREAEDCMAEGTTSSDSDSDNDSCEKIVMHHLAECNEPRPDPPPEPENIDDRDHGDDNGDPDDPDPGPDQDPDQDPDPDSEDENDDDSDEEGDTFSFDDVRLNTPLQFGHAGCTVRESILLNLSLAVKYHWTYEALADSMASWSTALGRRGFIPETKKQLWSIIKKSSAGITKYAYCPHCLEGFGRVDELEGEIIVCEEPTCGEQTPRVKVPFFVSLSLRKQFQQFLAIPGISNHLRYREERRKHRENAMEDIFDGEVYRRLVDNGTITENDFTYLFNTDGFSLFKHRSLSVWGLLVRLNELPPNIRQKYMFLAAVWVDKKEPKMNTFMAPFVQQANKLSRRGLRWQREEVNEVISKFIAIGLIVDAPARALCLNQIQFNGNFGCYVCNHQGIYLLGCVRFPILPFEDLPDAVDRTNDSITTAMERNVLHEGQKGPSELMILDNFDLAEGNCMDDLHPFYEGITAAYLNLLIPNLHNPNRALNIVNFRMRDVRTPIQMSRKWLSIRKRNSWKGSQWSYFVRYEAVLCFLDNNIAIRNLEHLSMLSYTLFVFSQDSIDPEDFDRASAYAARFAALYHEIYGPENMTFNMHMLTHAAQARRRWSSAWTTSTFNFESWNRQLGVHVTSAKGAADQMVARHLLKMYVHLSPYRNDISQRVKDQLCDTLFAYQRKLSERIDEDIYVLGRGRERPATLQEQNFLQREGVESRVLTAYERMLVRGIEYRIRTYHEDTRSDNSHIFTWENSFLTIDKIIVVQVNGNKICFALATIHHVDYPIRFAHHIAHVLRSEETILRPSVIRVPVIKMVVREETYLVPMANCHEID